MPEQRRVGGVEVAALDAEPDVVHDAVGDEGLGGVPGRRPSGWRSRWPSLPAAVVVSPTTRALRSHRAPPEARVDGVSVWIMPWRVTSSATRPGGRAPTPSEHGDRAPLRPWRPEAGQRVRPPEVGCRAPDRRRPRGGVVVVGGRDHGEVGDLVDADDLAGDRGAVGQHDRDAAGTGDHVGFVRMWPSSRITTPEPVTARRRRSTSIRTTDGLTDATTFDRPPRRVRTGR